MQLNIQLSDDDVDRIARRVVELLPATGPAPADLPRLYSEIEAAKLLGIGASTLKRMRLTGEVRAAVAKKPVRYSRDDVDAAARFMAKRS